MRSLPRSHLCPASILLALFLGGGLARGAAPDRLRGRTVRPATTKRVSPFAEGAQRKQGLSQFSLWARQGDGRVHPLYQSGIRPAAASAKGTSST